MDNVTRNVQARGQFKGSATMESRLRTAAESVPFVGPLHDLALADPLAALQATVRLRAAIADAEALAVAVARANRVGWRQLGPPMAKNWRTVYEQYKYVDGPLPAGRQRRQRGENAAAA